MLKYLTQFENREQILAFLLSIREELDWKITIDDEDLYRLIKDRIISRDYIKQAFILLISFYKDDDQPNKLTELKINTIDERIDEYRILFKGPRVGNMGNRKNCIDLMNKFMIEHPSITFDDIVLASIYYAQHVDMQYMMGAENFIYKMEDNGRLSSKLETVIEEYLLSSRESNLL